MATPTITINGKEIPMKTKARIWGVVMKFDKDAKDIPAENEVDKYCEIIAAAFGVTADEILDNMELDDVAPKYFEVYNEVSRLLTSKIKKNEKDET